MLLVNVVKGSIAIYDLGLTINDWRLLNRQSLIVSYIIVLGSEICP